MNPHIRTIVKHIMWNSTKTNWQKFVLGLIVLFVLGLFFLVYFCGYENCRENTILLPTPLAHSVIHLSDIEAYNRKMLPENPFSENDLEKRTRLNFDKDVIVFLHMQKTGGTYLGRNLVRNLNLKSPCKCFKGKKRCDCYTDGGKIWLFSRYSTGWRCGLHADWTELNPCVDGILDEKEERSRHRRYHYITILRDPIKRYLSEWKHVSRGATWKAARLMCNGKPANLPFCYEGEDWSGVTIDEFMSCRYNLATNRQTRMLANLTLVNCYNDTSLDRNERHEIMLKSAKENLLKMDYFGLTEFQKYSQQLFEHTFDLEFKEKFVQLPITHSDKAKLSDKQLARVLELNELDVKLYQYAKDLFLQRVKFMKQQKKDYSALDEYMEVIAEADIGNNYEDEAETEDDDY